VGQPGRRADRERGLDGPFLDRDRLQPVPEALNVDELPGNSAKIRLLLDLLERRPARVLDVGCGDLSLWAALEDRPDVLGVDKRLPPPRVAGVETRELDARELPYRGEFDAVVSTQMLDDVHEWRDVLRLMVQALKPGGTLLLTCDSGDVPRPWRARLRGVPPGPALEELGGSARDAGLVVEVLRRYGRHDLKRRQRDLDGAGRFATMAYEESIEPDDPRDWGQLYLRGFRPGARSRPGESAPSG
jgi:SAM-dependent methyltransferase